MGKERDKKRKKNRKKLKQSFKITCEHAKIYIIYSTNVIYVPYNIFVSYFDPSDFGGPEYLYK